ncbi:MAG: helicase, partial [Bacteroidota bacterium]
MLDKFGLDAAVIRSGTIGELERQCAANETVFERFDLQVASIDLVKTERYRTLFMRNCPDLVIVDEAHTCTRPAGAESVQQQLRHALLTEVARRPEQHLLLLTATPHSGKHEEFHSLLGLLRPEFEQVELTSAPEAHRQKVAEHFIQRRRKNIQAGFGESTRFPAREALEAAYDLHPEYRLVFMSLLDLVRKMVQVQTANKGMQKLRYYTALTFLRGAMSSPRTGAAMLRRRAGVKTVTDSETPELESELLGGAVLEQNPASEDDSTPIHLADAIAPDRSEQEILQSLADRLEGLSGLSRDHKALSLVKLLEQWVREGSNVIVFCRFIDTANYLGEVVGTPLRKAFDKLEFTAETITSELPDEERR